MSRTRRRGAMHVSYAAAQQTPQKRAAATAGATRSSEVHRRGLGFDDEQTQRPLATFSGGELTRAPRWPGAQPRARPAVTRRADQPPGHPLAGVALEALPSSTSTPPVRPRRPTTAGSSKGGPGTSVLELEPRRARFFAGPWPGPAPGQAARQGPAPSARRSNASRTRSRAWEARRRALPRYKATKAKQAQSRVKQIEQKKRDGPQAERRDTQPALLLPGRPSGRAGSC